QRVHGIAAGCEIRERKIDPPARQVRPDVAEDVRELERHPEIFGVDASALLLVTEDAQAYESHDRGDAIAVPAQLLEGAVPELRQIHLHPGDQLLQIGAWNAKAEEMGAKRQGSGLGGLPFVARGDLAAPYRKLLARAARVRRF